MGRVGLVRRVGLSLDGRTVASRRLVDGIDDEPALAGGHETRGGWDELRFRHA
jgi:hypothetical protein